MGMRDGDFELLQLVTGTVVRTVSPGCFVELAGGKTGFLDPRAMTERGEILPLEDRPQPGDVIEAVVTVPELRGRPRLSIRPSLLADARRRLDQAT